MRKLLFLGLALMTSVSQAGPLPGTRPDDTVPPSAQSHGVTCDIGHFLIKNAISEATFEQEVNRMTNPRITIRPEQCDSEKLNLHFWVVPIASDAGEKIYVINSELENVGPFLQQKFGKPQQ